MHVPASWVRKRRPLFVGVIWSRNQFESLPVAPLSNLTKEAGYQVGCQFEWWYHCKWQRQLYTMSEVIASTKRLHTGAPAPTSTSANSFTQPVRERVPAEGGPCWLVIGCRLDTASRRMVYTSVRQDVAFTFFESTVLYTAFHPSIYLYQAARPIKQHIKTLKERQKRQTQKHRLFVDFLKLSIFQVIFTSTKKTMSLLALVSQLVCLFVSRITQKLLNGFSRNLVVWHMGETIRCKSGSHYVLRGVRTILHTRECVCLIVTN